MGFLNLRPTMPRVALAALVFSLVVGLAYTIGFRRLPFTGTSFDPIHLHPRLLLHPLWTPVIIYRQGYVTYLHQRFGDWALATPYWLITSYMLACLILPAPKLKHAKG